MFLFCWVSVFRRINNKSSGVCCWYALRFGSVEMLANPNDKVINMMRDKKLLG